MTKLVTVRRAKEEIRRLPAYINLVVPYEADTLEKVIIKAYAYNNSIKKVVQILDDDGIMIDDEQPVDRQHVINVIKSKPKDELHHLVRAGYLAKTKHSRSNHDLR